VASAVAVEGSAGHQVIAGHLEISGAGQRETDVLVAAGVLLCALGGIAAAVGVAVGEEVDSDDAKGWADEDGGGEGEEKGGTHLGIYRFGQFAGEVS